MINRYLLRNGTFGLSLFLTASVVAFAAARYVDKTNGWSLEPPTGWQIEQTHLQAKQPTNQMEKSDSKGPLIVTWYGPTKNNYRLNLRVRTAPYSGKSLDPLIADGKKAYSQDPDVVKILSDKKLTLSGSPAWTISVQRKMPDGLLLEQRQVVALKSGRVVILTGSIPSATAKEDGPVLDKVRDSFKWDK
jgi:hypothetical protein